MVSARLRCVCCALPARVLEHVAACTGEDVAKRLAEHHASAEAIRSQRHAAAQAGRAAPGGGQRQRRVYDARGQEQLPGHLVRAEGAAPAADTDVNHAYDNVGITLAFFQKVFGRDSLDGRGMDVDATVHWGRGFANAMWNGEQMLFGDGDGVHIGGFTRSLDIVAHELTHAVTQHTVPGGLGVVHRHGKPELVGQAGAVNESLSDVFASLVKQWHAKQDVRQADWLVGEGILAPQLGRAVRSLKSPGDRRQTYGGDDQVGDMRGYVEGGEVHANSGIPNHAFYLAANALGGHAWEQAGRIWYEALAALKADSGFVELAHATGAAAGKVFGTASKAQHAVQSAWVRVGVLRA